MSDDRLADLPDAVAQRARDLREYGLPLTLAVGRAAETLAATDPDWDYADIADAFGVESADTIKTYASKARTRIKNAQRLFVAEHGGAAHILAEHDKLLRNGTVFITAEFGYPGGSYDEATSGAGRVAVVSVEVGGPSGEPSNNRRVTTESFDSLDALADAKYRDADHHPDRYRFWYDLLVDAGVDEETLADPGEKLPPEHPDSADHLQHQMQSLEPPEGRRPPRDR